MKHANVELKTLVPAERNANVMDNSMLRSLVESMKRAGFLQPILVREREDGKHDIVDGHHRVKAAKRIKLKEVPAVILAKGESLDSRLVALGMNKHRGELNIVEVGLQMQDLLDDGFSVDDLLLTGHNKSEIEDLLEASDGMELDEEDIVKNTQLSLEDEDDTEAPLRPWVLELQYSDRSQLNAVKKKLRKAAGGSKDMSIGLLNLLGLLEESND